MKICIDPGHGMSNRKSGLLDPGAVSNGVAEKDIVLLWALTLKYYLTKAGIPVFLTRTNDTDVAPVSSRDDRAEAEGCTHFISLHCNAGESRASGTETYYRDAADKNFANVIQNLAVGVLGLKSRGLKTEHDSQHSRLAIFDFDGAACLLELGFISNSNDRAKMLDLSTRTKFAEKLAEYFKGLK
jgi:N-acetylmuramoyl-L-alanine amidase